MFYNKGVHELYSTATGLFDNTVGVGANDPQGRRLTQITSVFV